MQWRRAAVGADPDGCDLARRADDWTWAVLTSHMMMALHRASAQRPRTRQVMGAAPLLSSGGRRRRHQRHEYVVHHCPVGVMHTLRRSTVPNLPRRRKATSNTFVNLSAGCRTTSPAPNGEYHNLAAANSQQILCNAMSKGPAARSLHTALSRPVNSIGDFWSRNSSCFYLPPPPLLSSSAGKV